LKSIGEATSASWLHAVLVSINDYLLIPVLLVLCLEASGFDLEGWDLAFCGLFFAEWCVGLWAAEHRLQWIRQPANLVDLASAIPFGLLFQGLRLVRLFRLLRLLRVASRSLRFRGRAAKLLKAIGLVGSVVLAGAIAFRAVEPTATSDFEQALWWAIVTLSTVGYGDVMPATPAGHAVAALVMLGGLGVFGYLAGLMSAMLADDHDATAQGIESLHRELAEIRRIVESRDGEPS